MCTEAENWELIFFSLIFSLFSSVIFVYFFIFLFFSFSFCFLFVHFYFLISLIVFSMNFFSIQFRFLKQNQMKTTWPRADIAPKINHDDRGLTYACSAVVCYTKRCKIHIFYLRHMKTHEASISNTFHQKTWHQACLVFMLLALEKSHHKNLFSALWYLSKALHTSLYVLFHSNVST